MRAGRRNFRPRSQGRRRSGHRLGPALRRLFPCALQLALAQEYQDFAVARPALGETGEPSTRERMIAGGQHSAEPSRGRRETISGEPQARRH